jgi:beta-glucosidase-like glycosyl hydrolase
MACAKHFPGLGAAEFDPHQDLPIIQKNWKAMAECDLLPFAMAIEAGVEAIMSSHPAYPELDERSGPATFSRKIIHDSLRGHFDFKGVILTDDLKMGAVTKSLPLKEAGLLAVKAGHDLLLVCSDTRAQQAIFESLVWSYKKKELKTSELEASVERILRLREKNTGRFGEGKPMAQEEGHKLALEIARKGTRVLKDGHGLIPLTASCLKGSVFVLFPDLRQVARLFFIEPDSLNSEEFIPRLLQPFGIKNITFRKMALNPQGLEREGIQKEAERHDLVLFFSPGARHFPEIGKLLKRLEEKTKRLIVIALRDPRDAEEAGPKTACLTAHGFRICQLKAVVERLFSRG